MNPELAQTEVARLEAVVRSTGGSTAFAALCEAQRRAGRPEEAERVARDGLRRHPDHVAGRVALGLALLDLGRLEEARGELGRVLDAVPDHPLAAAALPGAVDEPVLEAELMEDLAEGELEQAFASAEADPEEMLDANGVAEAVVRAVESEPDEGADLGPLAAGPFATRSMADLLEAQGHGDEAHRLRVHAEDEATEATVPAAVAGAAAGAGGGERERVVRRLESWLDQLRKGRR